MPEFLMPTHVITGRGCVNQLGKVAAHLGQRALLVCGRHSLANGQGDRTLKLLQDADIQTEIFSGVRGEPTLNSVAEGITVARQARAEVIIGLGGGSALDTAKAIAGLLDLQGTPQEYHQGRRLERPGRPFVAVPTTSGTGAEVTLNAVLTDTATGVKNSIRGDTWFARVALVDPELTLGLPPDVTASSGSDALCQAIEAYTSIAAGPVTDALAMQAIALIGESLARAYHQGDDLAAREAMSMGSLMAGMAMASARLGGVHGMAHPLGARYHIPHGLVCGLLLPYTMDYNLDYAQAKYARVAALLGEPVADLSERDAALRGIDYVRALLREVAIPEHLAPFGLQPGGFDEIIAESLPSGSLKHNPRPLMAEDVRAILQAAL